MPWYRWWIWSEALAGTATWLLILLVVADLEFFIHEEPWMFKRLAHRQSLIYIAVHQSLYQALSLRTQHLISMTCLYKVSISDRLAQQTHSINHEKTHEHILFAVRVRSVCIKDGYQRKHYCCWGNELTLKLQRRGGDPRAWSRCSTQRTKGLPPRCTFHRAQRSQEHGKRVCPLAVRTFRIAVLNSPSLLPCY